MNWAHARLTDREREVLACLGEGIPVKAIAPALGVELNTARGHVRSLHLKTDTHSLVELVLWLVDHRRCCQVERSCAATIGHLMNATPHNGGEDFD